MPSEAASCGCWECCRSVEDMWPADQNCADWGERPWYQDGKSQEKHLQRQHPDEYEVVQSQALTRTASCSHSQKQQVQGQKKVDSFFAPAAPEKVLVRHNMESFKAALVEMAVDNAFSLRVFSTKGFKRLVGDLVEKLHVSLGKDQIRSYVISLPMLRRKG